MKKKSKLKEGPGRAIGFASGAIDLERSPTGSLENPTRWNGQGSLGAQALKLRKKKIDFSSAFVIIVIIYTFPGKRPPGMLYNGIVAFLKFNPRMITSYQFNGSALQESCIIPRALEAEHLEQFS